MEITIIEGTRGVGKTTVAKLLHNKIFGSTLVNPTGFPNNGEEGLDLITNYYNGWFNFLEMNKDNNYPIIFDRFFITEQVIHKQFKSYDFTSYYERYCDKLKDYNVTIFYLTIRDEMKLSKRLKRDKSILFNSVAETVENSMLYQESYDKVIAELEERYKGYKSITIKEIQTDWKSDALVTDIMYKEMRDKLILLN